MHATYPCHCRGTTADTRSTCVYTRARSDGSVCIR